MSEEKMYIKKVKGTLFGKEIVTEKSLLHYTVGTTINYWFDMMDGFLVDNEGNRDKETSKKSFIPIGWVSMKGTFFPSALEENNVAIKTAEGQIVFNPKSYNKKGILTVIGFFADDEKGTVKWDDFRNLVSIDFKTWSASNLLGILRKTVMSVDKDGNSTTLPMLRIKMKGLIPTSHPKAKQVDFDVSVNKLAGSLEFAYIVKQWLNDLEYPIYNEMHLDRIMEHNSEISEFFTSHEKICPLNKVMEFAPLHVEKVPHESGGFTIQSSKIPLVLEQGNVEEEESSFDMQMLGN